jgi:hypothetical protein
MDAIPAKCGWNLKKFPTKPWFRWVFHMGKGLLITSHYSPLASPPFHGKISWETPTHHLGLCKNARHCTFNKLSYLLKNWFQSYLNKMCVCMSMHGWMDGWKDVSMYATYNCIYILTQSHTHTCVSTFPDHTKSNFQGTPRIWVRFSLWQASMIFQHIPTNGWVYPRASN